MFDRLIASRLAWCYQLFREAYLDTWHEILITFNEAEALAEMEQTVSQQQQLFNKLAKNHRQSVCFFLFPHYPPGISAV